MKCFISTHGSLETQKVAVMMLVYGNVDKKASPDSSGNQQLFSSSSSAVCPINNNQRSRHTNWPLLFLPQVCINSVHS